MVEEWRGHRRVVVTIGPKLPFGGLQAPGRGVKSPTCTPPGPDSRPFRPGPPHRFEVRSTSLLLKFCNLAVQNVEGASVFWIRRLAAMGGEHETLAHWQTKRDHTRRGIVEVISDDSERSGT